MEHTADGGAVAFAACFLLDDAGQDKGFVYGLELAIRAALSPSCGQLLGHGFGGAAHHMQLGGAFAIGVGVGEKSTFWRHARHAELGHEFLVTQALGIVFETFRFGERGSELAKGPAVNQADGFEVFFASAEFAQQIQGRIALVEFVTACSQLA